MKKYDNFKNHLEVLKKAPNEDINNEFIISGIIDKFYLQFELGWKVLKELLQYEGRVIGKTRSPREIIKASYACFDFIEEDLWLSMLKERNDTAHIYDEALARKLLQRILAEYIPAFIRLDAAIKEQYKDIIDKI